MRLTVLRAGLLLVAAVSVVGCASVPLSTMWRLRSFGPEQLANIDPGTLRVAVLLEPEGLRLDVDKTRLALRLVPHVGEEQRHEWQLQVASAALPGLVPHAGSGWQLLRLTPEATRSVESLKPLLEQGEETFAGGEFSVSFGMADPERISGLEELFLTVRLSLAADQEPFTLLDRAEIPVHWDKEPAP